MNTNLSFLNNSFLNRIGHLLASAFFVTVAVNMINDQYHNRHHAPSYEQLRQARNVNIIIAITAIFLGIPISSPLPSLAQLTTAAACSLSAMGGTLEEKWEIGIQIVRGLSGRVDELMDVRTLQGRVRREPLAHDSTVDFLLNSWRLEQSSLLSQETEDSLAEFMTENWGQAQPLARFREMSPGGREKFICGMLAQNLRAFRTLQVLCSLIDEPPREERQKRRSGRQRSRYNRWLAKQTASSSSDGR